MMQCEDSELSPGSTFLRNVLTPEIFPAHSMSFPLVPWLSFGHLLADRRPGRRGRVV